MVELLAFVIAAVIVAAFWRLFAALAVVAAIGMAILAAVALSYDAITRTKLAADPTYQSAPAPAAAYELYRDDSRTAYPEQVLVGTYPTRGACQRAGEKLSYLADRVEVHYCREVTR
jgi:hypothetical protein